MGPTLPFCDELHAQKYRQPDETFEDAMSRVATALADGPQHSLSFLEILLNMRFMPAGRVQSAMGAERQTTPYNCYVAGTIADSFVSGPQSIMDIAKEAATTMRMGGGIGYDFSTLRPKGALINKLQSFSSGPISFMEIFDAVCRCVASSGHRRGAQMGVLRVDHPDIEEFVEAKQNSHRLTGFNISVAVTDEFMRAVMSGGDFDLRFEGQVYRTVKAADLWEKIMLATWDWAEPGVLFIDRINEMNNLRYCETLAATNPCGEQPLPPYGACLLGSFNLTRYLVELEGRYTFDWAQYQTDIPTVVRAMDNVVDRALYPLEAQMKEAVAKRRMGLGITGLANAAEMQGLMYGTPEFLEFTDRVLQVLRDTCYLASAGLAAEKGPFPLYRKEDYMASAFIRQLPLHVQAAIRQNGIRNSHLTSIAPTGTISLCADNVSSGIEPVFAYSFDRKVNVVRDGQSMQVTETVTDYAYARGFLGKQASDVTLEEHVAVLALAQKYVDSAVSKTCNVPPSTPWADFKQVYIDAWVRGAKGCTTFNAGGKRMGILVAPEAPKEETNDAPEAAPQASAPSAALPEEEAPATTCYIDPVTGRHECE